MKRGQPFAILGECRGFDSRFIRNVAGAHSGNASVTVKYFREPSLEILPLRGRVSPSAYDNISPEDYMKGIMRRYQQECTM